MLATGIKDFAVAGESVRRSNTRVRKGAVSAYPCRRVPVIWDLFLHVAPSAAQAEAALRAAHACLRVVVMPLWKGMSL